jgi:hypothetical protein
MEIKPVKSRKKAPEYPSMDLFIEHPELLSKSEPKSWKKKAIVSSALAVFVLSGSGCKKEENKPKIFKVADKNKNNSQKVIENNKKSEASISVAPVFVHGDGYGSVGCVVISPPIFISEIEARDIIFKAFEKENISFDTIDCPEIQFKPSDIERKNFLGNDNKNNNSDFKIKIDAYNKQLNLAIQFVSTDEIGNFNPKYGLKSTVVSYDTKRVAEIIRKKLASNYTLNSGIFYDPIPYMIYNSTNFNENKYDKLMKDTKNEAKQLLLAQVEDFIEWAKKEGVIK